MNQLEKIQAQKDAWNTELQFRSERDEHCMNVGIEIGTYAYQTNDMGGDTSQIIRKMAKQKSPDSMIKRERIQKYAEEVFNNLSLPSNRV